MREAPGWGAGPIEMRGKPEYAHCVPIGTGASRILRSGGRSRSIDPQEGQPLPAVQGDQGCPLRPPADVRSTDHRQFGAGRLAGSDPPGTQRAAVTSSPGAIMKAVPPEGVAASGGKEEDARIA